MNLNNRRRVARVSVKKDGMAIARGSKWVLGAAGLLGLSLVAGLDLAQGAGERGGTGFACQRRVAGG